MWFWASTGLDEARIPRFLFTHSLTVERCVRACVLDTCARERRGQKREAVWWWCSSSLEVLFIAVFVGLLAFFTAYVNNTLGYRRVDGVGCTISSYNLSLRAFLSADYMSR